MKKLIPLVLLIAAACSQNPQTLSETLTGGSNPTSNQAASYTGPITNFKLSCQEARFVELLNLYRQQNNLNFIAVSKNGVQSARWHTQDMINQNYFAHSEPNGRDFSARALSFGYPAWSENIAAGNSGADQTFCQWKNSPGHNSNMLGSQHQTIGIGLTSGGGSYGSYWENTFGPGANDTLSSPLTSDTNCVMPRQLPVCN